MAIFARAPSLGKAKTRLIPLLGAQGATEFHAALISDAIHKVDALTGHVSRWVFLAGRNLPTFPSLAHFRRERQRGADLGERLERAFQQLLRRHASAIVVGTDSPTFPPRILREALRELRYCEGVLGPCPDGGYYLIGLRRLRTGIFRGIRWGSAFAFRDTLRNLIRRGFSCSILEPFGDVDRPGDVVRLGWELTQSAAARRLAPAAWRFLKGYLGLRAGRSSAG